MKRSIIFAIAAAVITAASCSPLKLVMNSTDSEGVRTLLTSDQKLMGSLKGVMDIALGSRIEKKDTVLAVLLTANVDSGHGIFNKGNQMKIRLKDGSEIDLVNLYDKEYEETEETYVSHSNRMKFGYAYTYDYFTDDIWLTPYAVNQMVPEVRKTKNSLSYALYLISKTQLNDIISKGVVKLRVEIENDDIDMDDTSMVSLLFKDMYDVLRDGMNTNFVRSEF